MEPKKERLYVVDALRGFAILAILLLHNIEHFDLYVFPENLPAWMQTSDKIIWETLFFLFGGKVYPMFALLFGFTFFIQSNNQRKKGQDFSLRFAWRLLLLFLFGVINSAFFQGDILTIYAALGFLLIPFERLSDRVVLITALVLFVQPLLLYQIYEGLQDPAREMADPLSWTYFGKMKVYATEGTLWENIVGNLTNGKWAVLLWNWENGRFFHILSLFLFGFLSGRRGLFATHEQNKMFWIYALVISLVVFTPLFLVQINLKSWIESRAILMPLETLVKSWAGLSFMVALVAGFYLLFNFTSFRRVLNVLSPIGKMSLSNYVFQSIIGSFVYYGFGLGLYAYTGATYCLIIGLIMSVLVGYLCHWWASKYSHGPLEGIWHKLTWIGTNKS